MEALGLIGSVVSTGIGMIGAQKTAQANADAANYQAGVARNNEVIANQNAAYAIQAGQVNTQTAGMKAAAEVGTQTAGEGASGLDVNSPTSTNVRASTQTLGRLDELTEMNNADLKAYGYKTQATNFEAAARGYDLQAKNDLSAGGLAAGSSLIGGATSLSDKWLKMQLQTGTGADAFDGVSG